MHDILYIPNNLSKCIFSSCKESYSKTIDINRYYYYYYIIQILTEYSEYFQTVHYCSICIPNIPI